MHICTVCVYVVWLYVIAVLYIHLSIHQILQMTHSNTQRPYLSTAHTHTQSLSILTIISDPHLHLDLFVADYHGKGHSILIGGRWPGVAANWVFRMEAGGEAVFESVCPPV